MVAPAIGPADPARGTARIDPHAGRGSLASRALDADTRPAPVAAVKKKIRDLVAYVRIGSEPWVRHKTQVLPVETSQYYLLVSGADLAELVAGRVPRTIRTEAHEALNYVLLPLATTDADGDA